MNFKLIRKVLMVALFVPLMSFTVLHKYYFSLTQVEYIEKSKAVQITMNVFIDDIENALNEEFNSSFQLNTQNERPDIDTYFKDYLMERFGIELNGTIDKYNYIGHQYEGDVVYFYVEIENITSISSIEILNKVLMDEIPEQQNLVKLKINGSFKSLMLTIDNNKGLLKF